MNSYSYRSEMAEAVCMNCTLRDVHEDVWKAVVQPGVTSFDLATAVRDGVDKIGPVGHIYNNLADDPDLPEETREDLLSGVLDDPSAFELTVFDVVCGLRSNVLQTVQYNVEATEDEPLDMDRVAAAIGGCLRARLDNVCLDSDNCEPEVAIGVLFRRDHELGAQVLVEIARHGSDDDVQAQFVKLAETVHAIVNSGEHLPDLSEFDPPAIRAWLMEKAEKLRPGLPIE